MSCSDCKYLKESKKRDGALTGTIYYCSKVDNFVNGSNNPCDKFEKSYSRNSFESSKIYQDGASFSDDDKPVSYYIGLLILIIILGGIFKLLGY